MHNSRLARFLQTSGYDTIHAKPIVGARKATQVKDNLDCVNVKLSDEQLAQLDQVSQIELGFPHDFFNQEMPQSSIFGGQFKAIDNHRYTQIH